MNYTKSISFGIKRLRLQNKLTQEKFAEKINMSVQGYRNIEQGKYLPTAATVDKICAMFKCSPVDLLLPDKSDDILELQNLIISKIKNCPLEKLVKINGIIDLL
ncbi:MAG: helix-turn-helix transcriptional regulator [Candidatus Gastranaerophilaceae bacterium]